MITITNKSTSHNLSIVTLKKRNRLFWKESQILQETEKSLSDLLQTVPYRAE
jgi:hypothetical protein